MGKNTRRMKMKKTADVRLREKNENKTVIITDNKKPNITNEILEKWQRIINILAKILNVPAGLIMKITEDSMEVFLKSQNEENPYPEGGSDQLGHGLYCETVIGENKELLIDNALKYKIWKDNPDVKLNMLSYYGLPIQWEDQEFFGTICVLDNKTNRYNEKYKELINEFKLAIEADLKMLLYKEKLRYYAEMDILTSSYNRNKIEKILKDQFERSKRYGETFSLALMDINNLKKINDKYGHLKGDEIIKVFADSVNSRIRQVDSFGRWGGDEFILICPHTSLTIMNLLLSEISEKVIHEMGKIVPNSDFCYGTTDYRELDNNYQELLSRADQELYDAKAEITKKNS